MDLEKSTGVGLVMEGKEAMTCEVGSHTEFQHCRDKCKELEERSKKAEQRCMVLELEIEKRKAEFVLLEGKFRALEVGKIWIEDELKVLKRRNVELEKQMAKIGNVTTVLSGENGGGKVVDLTEEKDEEEKVMQLMVENKILECEKKRAEFEAERWELKYRDLELRFLQLEKDTSTLMVPSPSEMHERQTTKANGLKAGLNVVTSTDCLETENKTVDHEETIRAATRVNSTCPKATDDMQRTGTPLIDILTKQSTQAEERGGGFQFETRLGHGIRVRKQLAFDEEGSLSKKLAPPTPGSERASSFGIIDISDSEDEPTNTNVHMPLESQENRMVCVSTDFPSRDTMDNENKRIPDGNIKRPLLDQSDKVNTDGRKGNSPFISTPKRRRTSNIVTTDSESDDDNVPICKIKTKYPQELKKDELNCCPNTANVYEEKARESATPRRRLVTLGNCNTKNAPEHNSPCNSNHDRANYHSGVPTNQGIENDEMEDESESDTEDESLGGFIVSSSDVSDSDNGSSASEEVSDDDVDFDEVLSRFRRSTGQKLKWEFEADMLAAFGKDLELCMKAVCALYRQQTSEEKISKGTLYSNQRGFSQCDAFRGTTLAEFLADGDPKGDLKKTVEELSKYDPKGPELCRTLATRYSKQLFAIYKNNEDPLFLPP
ncbi:uncharacterized protein LOC127787811 [Diospyros lotus]|uniref:uncharacterized protein LOC127787811 n=1 Tax=Diospyros lotus TaxID=55363 RepID=UPI002254AB2F|nr:uncharacterized protein LOC127787811 [Diospyros lotus]XP_052171797.1 uncharacterized protein LOC127787811 [Diospyros lotus]XP_052171805.1 uncharacterized protein LOC127787811 [Diospyros lotus]XP_052171814.1 uncharacterized protein LOC127787811 [Diospyros lotus]